MDGHRRYEINGPNVIHETIDGETVIINLMSGRYYCLLGSGSQIWNLIEQRASLGQAARWLAQQHQLPETEMLDVMAGFVAQLSEEGLIRSQSPSKDDYRGGTEVALPALEPGAHHPFEPPTLRTYTDMQDLLLLDPIHELDDAGWPMTPQEPSSGG